MPRPTAPTAWLATAAALLVPLVVVDARTARAAYTYTDALAAGPTFNRPLANGDAAPIELSNVGTAVSYSAFGFIVDAAGTYSFLSSADFDNYTFLYQANFDPTAPLSNVLIGNDDYNSTIGLSGFSYDLAAGVRYVFVTTSYYNDATGPFTDTIDGPGMVTPNAVPAPPSLALLALALPGGLVAARAGRRRPNP